MANQISVNTGTGNQQVTVTSTGNIQVTTSRSVIGTISNVPTANFANYAANVTASNQPNITSVGTLTSLTSNGNITAPFFLGNVIGNITGNLVVPGTNTSVLFNQTGNAGASDALKFDYAANVLTANGNIVANYYSGNGSQLTGIVATQSNNANFANFAGNAFSVSGSNVTGAVSYATTANSVAGANVSGAVAFATTANSVALANVVGAGNIASINISGNTSQILYGNGVFAAAPNVSNVANANYANFAGTAFNVSASNITGVVNLANFATTANSVAGANVSGIVANATYANTSGSANTAGTVTTNAQPNITSVGTLTGLVVSGNITPNANITYDLGNNTNRFKDLYLAGNSIILGAQTISANATGISVTGNLSGDASGLSNIAGANVTGTVANANYSAYSGIAGSANSVAGANVSGTVANATHAVNSDSANGVSGANVTGQVANALVSGTVYTNAQPNITSVGTLTSLSVTGNITGFANITGDYFLGNGAFLTGVGNFSAAQGYHGSFFSNVTQTIASTTTAYPITLNNTSPGTYGVSITSNSRVTFTYAGTYNIQYSVQFTNTDTAVHNASIWLRKNGVDVPDTNSLFAVTARHGSTDGQLIGAINYIEDVNANDYYELIWQAESTSVSLEYIGPGTTPTSPATPSIIVTAMQVTNVQAATLSGNLTGDLIGNTHGLTGTSFINIIGNISGNVFTGNGSGLTQLDGANVTGAVALANTANSVALGNVSGAGNIASINLDGNVSNVLSGNGSFVALPTVSANANYANFAGQVVDATQSNITAVGTLTTLTVSGTSDLGNVGNVKITGGTANYVLSTDGSGNLDWVAQTGGGNTGNVTFDNVTVQGVNGLQLSADPTFTANLAYLQVRAGDVASHIHLDTGNNNAYDLIVGDDAKFVQVSSTGNILMSSYDGNLSYAWNMDNTGNLILPGNTFAVNYANGTQVSIGGGTPGGNTTELQYNNAGAFGGMPNVTFDGSNISLGDISTVKIAGGTANDFIQTDGAGNLSFAGIATNLIVGTRISPVTILISNYQMNVLSRTGNVVVYVN